MQAVESDDAPTAALTRTLGRLERRVCVDRCELLCVDGDERSHAFLFRVAVRGIAPGHDMYTLYDWVSAAVPRWCWSIQRASGGPPVTYDPREEIMKGMARRRAHLWSLAKESDEEDELTVPADVAVQAHDSAAIEVGEYRLFLSMASWTAATHPSNPLCTTAAIGPEAMTVKALIAALNAAPFPATLQSVAAIGISPIYF
jgi:hypothetical protein